MDAQVLLVCDDLDVSRVWVDALRREPIRVLLASSCGEARTRWEDSFPDLVIVDLHTQPAEGLCRDLRSETGQSAKATVTVTCNYGEPPSGCTRTQGYWKTHASAWPAGQAPSAVFFSSGQTWLQVLWTAPSEGNVYYILAHQYIAATLNILSGAASTQEVNEALEWATNFFNTYKPTDTLSKTVRNQATSYASLLDSYNNGTIGPGHCSE